MSYIRTDQMVMNWDGEKMPARRGSWSPEEDQKLKDYIKRYGIRNWCRMPEDAGLARSGKSCRLRWMNYLRPDIKRGSISEEEEETILKWHELLGNRWSAIASKLPGRTDNEIKNFWHTHLKRCSKNTLSSTTISEMAKSSEVEVSRKDSSGIQYHLLLFDAQNLPNMGANIKVTPTSTQMPINDLSSSSTDPDAEVVQHAEENFNSSESSYQKIVSIWEQPFSFQDMCMLETEAEFMVPTTAMWIQEPMYPYVYHDTGYDLWNFD